MEAAPGRPRSKRRQAKAALSRRWSAYGDIGVAGKQLLTFEPVNGRLSSWAAPRFELRFGVRRMTSRGRHRRSARPEISFGHRPDPAAAMRAAISSVGCGRTGTPPFRQYVPAPVSSELNPGDRLAGRAYRAASKALQVGVPFRPMRIPEMPPATTRSIRVACPYHT